VVAVVSGEGIRAAFEELGVKGFVSGGQSMNPSTDDILKAIYDVACEDVIVLPNNSNIILAAQQAAELTKDCRVHVVPTKTIPQGMAAALCLNPQLPAGNNLDCMNDAYTHVKSGQITYAVRDSGVNGKTIHENDVLGIGEGEILSVGGTPTDAAVSLVEQLLEDEEIITLYYGEGVTQDEAEATREAVAERFPACEVELCPGGQPVYSYILSLE